MPHPAYKVAVGGGDGFFPFGEDAHISAEAGAAGRGGDNATSVRVQDGAG